MIKLFEFQARARSALALGTLIGLAGGCGGGHFPAALPNTHESRSHRSVVTLPTYVIVIVQENRSVDNLFQTQPGVDTQNFGWSNHKRVPLTMVDLNVQYDCDHSHFAFVADVAYGFGSEHCGKNAPPNRAFAYVNPSQITQYTALATQYAFADEVLQSSEGASFPAHLYLVAGTSGDPGSNLNIAEDGAGHQPGEITLGRPAGCNAPPGSTDATIDMTSAFPGKYGTEIFPCLTSPTIFDELDSAQISWKYYTSSVNSLWTAPYAFQSLYQNDKADVVVPPTAVLSDIQNGNLAQVSYVIPSSKNSDHPKAGKGGPTWVASIVNALGTSQYWNQCAIIVVWDDWGGWFDHVHFRHPPNHPKDPYEYGLRVPLLAIGPFAKPGYVDHTPRDFSAIPHFIEDVYGLASLGQLDAQTDDLFALFNFGSQPRKYKWIPTGNVTIKGLIDSPSDTAPIDSE